MADERPAILPARPLDLEPPALEHQQPSPDIAPAQADASPGNTPEQARGGEAPPPSAYTPGAPSRPRPLAAAELPPLPQELDDELGPRERALVWLLVAGSTWTQALDALGYPPRARIRDAGPSAPIRAAADWLVSAFSARCGVSREWILAQYVAVYERATEAGDFDGSTAIKALERLAEQADGMKARRPGSTGIPADAVAELLAGIARRGKPALEHRRAALQQSAESLTDQGHVSVRSSVIREE